MTASTGTTWHLDAFLRPVGVRSCTVRKVWAAMGKGPTARGKSLPSWGWRNQTRVPGMNCGQSIMRFAWLYALIMRVFATAWLLTTCYSTPLNSLCHHAAVCYASSDRYGGRFCIVAYTSGPTPGHIPCYLKTR